jgi:restriction system protein
MAIPDFQSFLLPLLRAASVRGHVTPSEAQQSISREFALSEEELRQRLPSGNQFIFANRVGWARTYLKKAGLLESPKRGIWAITRRGLDVLAQRPERIDVRFLRQFPEFAQWHAATAAVSPTESSQGSEPSEGVASATAAETLQQAFARLRDELADELLSAVRQSSPAFFEQLVVDVLVKMGYGGSREDAGQAVGGTGDGGIDGIIKEDRLGLDTIYVQAKRWEGPVGRPDIQKFAGALQGHRARKGVFITTSNFTRDAEDYVSRIDSKIVLIDGASLAKLMIEHDVGVNAVETFRIKRLDSDYFSEE